MHRTGEPLSEKDIKMENTIILGKTNRETSFYKCTSIHQKDTKNP